MNFNDLIGVKLISYLEHHSGCYNKNEFVFENGLKLIFGHEDSEGSIYIEKVEK